MSLTFAYWDCRGIAQPIRFLLEYLAIPYEDKRYTDINQWFFGGEKASQQFKDQPLVNLPYIKDGENYIFESRAIYTYLIYKAERLDLRGGSLKEIMLMDQAHGIVDDIVNAFYKNVHFIKKEVFETKGWDLFMEKIFPLYSKLEKFLGDRKFVSGENLTYVDFIVYEIEDKLRCFCHETFAKFPKLVNHFNTVSELPAIHAYRTSQGYKERPFLPKGTNWD